VIRHAADETLARAQAALAAGDAVRARDLLEDVVADEGSAAAHEALSEAAAALDDGRRAMAARAAAFRLYREGGEDVAAARMALWLGKDHEEIGGAPAVGAGWRRRARSLLDGQPPAPEHGWLPILECWAALRHHDEDPETVRRHAAEAAAAAEACGDSDLALLARALDGLGRVGAGDVAEGMGRLDEAGAAVTGGELDAPIWGLAVFCWLIYACERVRDVARARQWCEAMRESADHLGHTGSRAFCRAHLGGLLVLGGDWADAEAMLTEAEALFAASFPAYVEDARLPLAELRRRQGHVEAAEALLAGSETRSPALLVRADLALDRGDAAAARACAERFLRRLPPASRIQRAAGLERLIRAAPNPEAAAPATAELDAIASLAATLPMRAAAARAGAAAAPDPAEACRHLEDAADRFSRAGLLLEAAEARSARAEALAACGQADEARAEAVNAARTCAALGAAAEKPRGEFSSCASPDAPDSLTPRQRDVLARIAAGRTNREIAAELSLSEKTVDRHLSNILLRLGVPSRAAAAAKACRQGLI
jgi:LuxR family transcriptional regulator, maltose regulon positive regulatory protein